MKGKEIEMRVGDTVKKTGGDYSFYGIIVSRFRKWKDGFPEGPERYVVQNVDGVLHIFAAHQLVVVRFATRGVSHAE